MRINDLVLEHSFEIPNLEPFRCRKGSCRLDAGNGFYFLHRTWDVYPLVI